MTHVAAAIIRRNGKILICQRGEGGNCAYLWEFPGGKQESGETSEQCLLRECREELGVFVSVKSVFAETTYRYPNAEISFTFYEAEIVEGSLEMRIHKALEWVSADELDGFAFCPADVQIIRRLRGTE